MLDPGFLRRVLAFSKQVNLFKQEKLTRKEFIELIDQFVTASENASEGWINFMNSIAGSIDSSHNQIIDEKAYNQSALRKQHLEDEIVGIEQTLIQMQSEYLIDCEQKSQVGKLTAIDEDWVQCSNCCEAFEYGKKYLPTLKNTERDLKATFCPYCYSPLFLDSCLFSKI
ncbi:MAG: hypothetical protein S4CHLAM6_08350 [Chlamydiae bacterium]|nr:hypothetical protein [Chlamydiota bacterium]